MMNNNNSHNNVYSDLLRKRSKEFYLKNSETNDTILRSSSSLSLDQNVRAQQRHLERQSVMSTSIDFKDFQELRECRSSGGNHHSNSHDNKSLTLNKSQNNSFSVKTKSESCENLKQSSCHDNRQHKRIKSFFNKKSLNDRQQHNDSEEVVAREECERARRMQRMFVHFDVSSALTSAQDLFSLDDTVVVGGGESEPMGEQDQQNEFNSNSLLTFSDNFLNEVGLEPIYALELRRETDDDRRRQINSGRPTRDPIHTSCLSRQISCLSSFDMNESQTLLTSTSVTSASSQVSSLSSTTEPTAQTTPTFCPFDKSFDFESNVLEMDFGLNYYRKYFYGFSHQNWFQIFDNKTAIALSLRKDSKDLQKLRIILRTNHSLRSLKGFIKVSHNQTLNIKHVIDLLFPKVWTKNPHFLSGFRLGIDSKSDELLLKMDELLHNKCFKIGILYSKSFQTTEEDFYNNRNVNDKDFRDFLDIIGEKVRLKDFKGFRAGLDVSMDTTGRYSYWTQFLFNEQKFDVMYHVMSELPFTPNNRQQLLRKRHIGNDIITLVFQQRDFRGKPFDPQCIRSHFQHVFLVVRPHGNGYRVAVARHRAVPPFGPPLKHFYSKQELRNFLLTKIINAENHCHKVNKFRQMALRTRFEYLNDLFTNYSTQTSIHSLMTSSSNTSQQLLQFSTNFNQFFSQIFSKNVKTKEMSREVRNDVICVENEKFNSFINNDMFFGAKLYQSLNGTLFVKDFSREMDLTVSLLLNEKFLIFLDKKRIIFSLKLETILGWIFTKNLLKIYCHFGELLLLREECGPFGENASVLGELCQDLGEISKDLKAKEMKEILLKRNSLEKNSFGFHLQNQRIFPEIPATVKNSMIVITEVNEFAKKVNKLCKNERIVELCEISLLTLNYEQILDFLKTSQSVSLLVIACAHHMSRSSCASPQKCAQTDSKTVTTTTTSTTPTTVSSTTGDYENISIVLNQNSVTNRVVPTDRARAVNCVVQQNQRQTNRQNIGSNLNQNNNHLLSDKSSTTSSTLQEDLIKLLTLNDCDIEEDDERQQTTTSRTDPNDSRSSSLYSTATSTPYSSLERRHDRSDDDCVVTLAKPAFVVNVNEFNNNSVGRRLSSGTTTALTTPHNNMTANERPFGRLVPEVLNNNANTDDSDSHDIEWPSLVATATRVVQNCETDSNGDDFELKEQVKELSEERKRLNETIRQLKAENQRLHFESQTASQQLRKFTEWFFNSNNH